MVKKEVKKRNKIILSMVVVLIVLVIAFIYYFSYYYIGPCKDEMCFRDAVSNCRRVSWIKENDQADWNYIILGHNDESSCKTQVTLLRLNNGTTDLNKLQNEEMVCNFPKVSKDFPETDMSTCSGVLKEDLQDILIQRMHDYLMQNCGQIKEAVSQI